MSEIEEIVIEKMPSNVIVSTGNVLNLNKKPGRKSSEELVEAMKITLENVTSKVNQLDKISRSPDDLHEKLKENDRNDISIGAKIFLNGEPSDKCLNEAINSLIETLGVDYVDNIVLAYHANPKCVKELGGLWKNLEEHYEKKSICQLGIADADTETVERLYQNSKVKPVIVQINLSSCCVVPPALQEFCNKHEIQLLTHSDPEPEVFFKSIEEIETSMNLIPQWTVRYQVHVKCRGVLSAKGYIVGATRKSDVGDS